MSKNASARSKILSKENNLSLQGKGATPFCKEPGTLYLVATPIGNLGDITFRAIETLKQVDLIACEDTRVSQKLLNHYGIKKSLLSYHDHNAAKVRPVILKALKEGKQVALLSDAGTPLISDPGHKLVQDVLAENLACTLLPGASAFLMGVVLSGLPTDRFFFAGFPPSKTQGRKKFFEELKQIPGLLVFYESAQRTLASLEDMQTCFGDRPAAVARELTKKFEQVLRGTLSSLKEDIQNHPSFKGEVVILVGPGEKESISEDILRDKIRQYRHLYSLKDTVQKVIQETKVSRKQVYQLALSLERK